MGRVALWQGLGVVRKNLSKISLRASEGSNYEILTLISSILEWETTV
jgi:hypothetical protein